MLLVLVQSAVQAKMTNSASIEQCNLFFAFRRLLLAQVCMVLMVGKVNLFPSATAVTAAAAAAGLARMHKDLHKQ